jgi:fimbrial chaperone protein
MTRVARAALLLLTFAGAAARAGGLNVSPIHVHLAPDSTKALLTLRNDGDEVVRYEVTANSWSQGPDGEMQLGPTSDIVFFPTLFQLKPGEERSVRIGVATQFGLLEKTYRVFVEELPPAEKPAQPVSQVRVLTRVGVPVFLAPTRAVEHRNVQDVELSHGKLRFKVVNDGTVHFREDAVRVRGLTAQGEELFAREKRGWYVLAGGSIAYDFELPSRCERLAAVVVQVTTDNGDAFEERLPAGAAGCAP